MTTNYYSVIQDSPNLMPRMVISFTNKDKAKQHASLLNSGVIDNKDKYKVVPSEITLFTRSK